MTIELGTETTFAVQAAAMPAAHCAMQWTASPAEVDHLADSTGFIRSAGYEIGRRAPATRTHSTAAYRAGPDRPEGRRKINRPCRSEHLGRPYC